MIIFIKSYISIILYDLKANDNQILSKLTLLFFNSIIISQTIYNIQKYYFDSLEEYSIFKEIPIITDLCKNIIEIGIKIHLIVFFCHRIHTAISCSFIKTKENNNLLKILIKIYIVSLFYKEIFK